MARLNISLPDELYRAAQKWRGLKNLSQICARALQEELGAAEIHRTSNGLLAPLKPPSELERALAEQFGLAEASVVPNPNSAEDLREALGKRAAAFLDRWICDDAMLAIGGGRQMWRVVHNLSPRSVRASIFAMGFRENDPQILHVHPNTLVTLLWLLYSPGVRAQLVSAAPFNLLWDGNLPRKNRPSYFVLASCAPLRLHSPFAQLIGDRQAVDLMTRGATGDYAYVFFDSEGTLIDSVESRAISSPDCSLLRAQDLQALSSRDDARVVMVAGGQEKLPILRAAIENQLCNVVVTDTRTAETLLA